MLSSLRERIARILANLPEARDFALAGGAAVIAGGLVNRETKDLDFFADRPEAVLELLPVLEERLRHDGLQVERRQARAGFAQLAQHGVVDRIRKWMLNLVVAEPSILLVSLLGFRAWTRPERPGPPTGYALGTIRGTQSGMALGATAMIVGLIGLVIQAM